MLTSSRFNYLIEITQKIISAIGRMRVSYAAFPALIAREHDMIISHTYTADLEAVCLEKTTLAEAISTSFDELQQLSQQIYNIWGDVDCEGMAIYPGDLSNCLAMVESIYRSIANRHSDFAISVLELQISRFRDELMAFKVVATDVKPKIELNRTALSGVVKNYQDSTRVLIELCEQAQSTYSARGTQTKSSTGTSTIFVRA